jgi:hypothetical protein
MATFGYEWNDFRGSLFVGPSEVNQPKNTWRGENVTISDDEATLVPTYESTVVTLTGTGTTGGQIASGTTSTTWSDATYFNDIVCFVGRTSSATTVYFIQASTGAVTKKDLADTSPDSTLGAPVLVTESGAIVAYVATGNSKVYRVVWSTLAETSYATIQAVTHLTLWNARMIAWSNSSDQFIFSDALDFTTWPSLNYVGVGYSNDGISFCVPRNLDLVVVKPSGWYSITGVLGTNASVRQMNDVLGVISNDSCAQHNNVVYFTTDTGYEDFSVNLYAITGSNVDVAAFHRFGFGGSNAKTVSTNLGYLAVVAKSTDGTSDFASVYLLNSLNRWQYIKIPASITSAQNRRFLLANGQVSRYTSSASDRTLYLLEYSNGDTKNSVALRKVFPNTVEPGKTSGASTPSFATVKLSDIATQRPTTIRRVYVEAEMLQPPSGFYTGSASIQVRVNNKSVHDIPFSQTTGDATSGLSTAYTFPFSTFSSSSTAPYSQIRVLRFNMDNASYGYLQEVEIYFSGLRIRRCWVEGDSQ